MLFLSKAHLCRDRADNLRRRLKFDEMLVSVSDGRSGGLVILWNRDIDVTSNEVTPNFIDIRISERGEAGWCFTGFYGEPSGEGNT